MWCEDEERSIPLQVERGVKVNTQGKDQLLLLRVSRRLAIFRQLTYQIYYTRIYTKVTFKTMVLNYMTTFSKHFRASIENVP